MRAQATYLLRPLQVVALAASLATLGGCGRVSFQVAQGEPDGSRLDLDVADLPDRVELGIDVGLDMTLSTDMSADLPADAIDSAVPTAGCVAQLPLLSDQVLTRGSRPEILAAPAGFALVYQADVTDAPTFALYDFDGSLTQGPVTLDDGAANNPLLARIAGGWLIFWLSVAQSSMLSRTVDDAGQLGTLNVLAPATTRDPLTSIAVLSDGRVVVGFHSDGVGAFIAILQPDGSLSSPVREVTVPAGPVLSVAVASEGATIATAFTVDDGDQEIFFQEWDRSLEPSFPAVRVTDNTFLDNNPKVGWHPGEARWVVFHQSTGGPDDRSMIVHRVERGSGAILRRDVLFSASSGAVFDTYLFIADEIAEVLWQTSQGGDLTLWHASLEEVRPVAVELTARDGQRRQDGALVIAPDGSRLIAYDHVTAGEIRLLSFACGQ